MTATRTAAALAAFAIALPLAAGASCQVETIELPVRMVGLRATATVGINGTPVPMTVDSGAFFSMLTEAAAEQLKLTTKRNTSFRVEGVTGSVDVRTTMVDKLKLFKGEIGHVEFIVGGNEPGAGTMGLMGRNVLSLADTEYDLAHGVIRFLFPNDDCARSNMAYWAGTAPVSELDLLTDERSKLPAIRARAKLNGSDLVAMLDTGATTLISTRSAKRAGIVDTDLAPAGAIYGAGRGRADAWTAAFATFELGGETIRQNRLRVADIDLRDADMLLGIEFFLSHRIYVSRQQSRMFFTYNGGPVFALGSPSAAADADVASLDLQALTADELARRGAASASRRDYRGALADLNRACELEPTSAALFAQRGAIHEALDQRPEALADFDRALELDATQTDARFARARLRHLAKDAANAKADLDVLDATLPLQAHARLAMAQLYLGLDEPTSAIAQLNRWLVAHPNDVTRGGAFNSRCWARVRLGVELDRALDDCDEAVDSNPKNAAFLDSRGWVYLRMGETKKALADFDRGLGYDPKAAESLYGRGLARTRLGDSAHGEADLGAARKLRPDIDATLRDAGLTNEPLPKR